MAVNRKHSNALFLQLSTLLATVSVTAITFIFAIFLFSEESSGKGSAINVSGSLRMQSYVMALAVANSSTTDDVQRTTTVGNAIIEFERRLLSPSLVDAIPTLANDPIRRSYEKIKKNFYDNIRPLAEQVIISPKNKTLFLQSIPVFVEEVDIFVLELETLLEERVQTLKLGLTITMFLALLIGVVFLLYLYWVLFRPLHDLSNIASEVRSGNFSIRSDYSKKNEIGYLCESMNYMIQDLSRLYESLEEQVRIKTADLDERNKALNLLYTLRSTLSEKELNRELLHNTLWLIDQHFKTYDCSIILFRGMDNSELFAARALLNDEFQKFNPLKLIEKSEIKTQEVNTTVFEHMGASYSTCILPLRCNTKYLGCLLLTTKKSVIEPQELQLMKSTADLIASILNTSDKQEEDFRLALYEERSTIARELHDSIAQSLAYAKIQLTRLSHAVVDNKNITDCSPIIDELKTGITTAYQQLREVLTTFRLKPSSTDFRHSVRSITEDFHHRTSIKFEINNEIIGYEISINQQIHILQILSEALSNVAKHSHANFVRISFMVKSGSTIELTIEDNGIGFNFQEKDGHFGLGIMRDRAQALGGKIYFKNATPQGTILRLEFKANSS